MISHANRLSPSRSDLVRLRSDVRHHTPFVYNVKGYGAKGDGLSDDTVAVQRAATAANAAGGGTVFFPAGVYLLSSPIDASSFVAVRFEGAGYGPVTAGGSDVLGSVLKASSTSLTAFFDVSDSTQVYITRFRFVATDAANTTVGIHDDDANSSYLTIRENHFRYFGGDGIRIRGNVYEVSYNTARLHNNGTGHIIHTNLGASDGIIAFNDIGSTDAVNGDGIFMDGATNGSQHCLITGNRVFNCRNGINLTANSINNRILGNRCEKHTTAGIVDATTASVSYAGNLIEGNACFDNGSAGITLNGCKNTDVVGNRCFDDSTASGDVQDYGIRLNAALDCRVVGNSCFDSTVDGIRVESASSRNLIADNYIRNIPRYGIQITGASNSNSINGNYIYLAGQETDNTYDGILVTTTCTDTSIRGNTIRHGGGATQTRYGIRINTNDCTDTQVLDNDLYTAGRSGALSDNGTSTILWHNRGVSEQGHQLYLVDNTYDIGASGATRPRTGYYGTSLIVGTDPAGAEVVRAGASGALTAALYRPTNSAAAAAAGLAFYAQNSTPAVADYAEIQGYIDANTAGSHDGGLSLRVAIAGTLTPVWRALKASFHPVADNTYTLGTTALRPSTVYGYTGDFSTEVKAPILDSGSNTDTVIQRNNVTKITVTSADIDTVGAVDSDTGFKKSGTQVVGAQGAAVADATDAASAITQLNALLARVRAHGLIAT